MEDVIPFYLETQIIVKEKKLICYLHGNWDVITF